MLSGAAWGGITPDVQIVRHKDKSRIADPSNPTSCGGSGVT